MAALVNTTLPLYLSNETLPYQNQSNVSLPVDTIQLIALSWMSQGADFRPLICRLLLERPPSVWLVLGLSILGILFIVLCMTKLCVIVIRTCICKTKRKQCPGQFEKTPIYLGKNDSPPSYNCSSQKTRVDKILEAEF